MFTIFFISKSISFLKIDSSSARRITEEERLANALTVAHEQYASQFRMNLYLYFHIQLTHIVLAKSALKRKNSTSSSPLQKKRNVVRSDTEDNADNSPSSSSVYQKRKASSAPTGSEPRAAKQQKSLDPLGLKLMMDHLSWISQKVSFLVLIL